MQVPIDPRAWRGSFVLLVLAAAAWQADWRLGCIVFGLGLAHLFFFRDFPRKVESGESLLAPADGRVVEMVPVSENRYLGEEAIKIGITLTLFDNHVTRSPLSGTVNYLSYEPGKFLNALSRKSVSGNESNWIGIENGLRRVLIRQMAGCMARRVYADIGKGQKVGRAQKLGIICYGSRVECFLPKRLCRPLIREGCLVRAGETEIGEWIKHE